LKEESLRRRIGVYGGTFDPIHNGHYRVAEAVLKCFAMERILFVPAYVPPHKRTLEISSPYHRLAMLALATAEAPQMLISTIELEAPSRPYTIETLQRLQSECPQARLFFVMGADSFRDITMWHEHERILNEYDVIVATRPGYHDGRNTAAHLAQQLQAKIVDLRGGLLPLSESLVTPHIYLTDYVVVDVSATDVRRIAAQGGEVHDFVPPAVAAYIAKYKLYQNLECQKF
jgi:nicotinate-nucleotide adenylyltransferase